MDDMINLVLKCLKCKNNGIIFVSLNFLEIVRLFEPKYGESIKTKKFKIQNQGFIKFVEAFEKEYVNSKVNNNYLYKEGQDDDDDQDYIDEDNGEYYYYHDGQDNEFN
jgi:hypothetical protein